jgi:ribonuclease BN (tRNA processing enzyme)
VYLLGTGDGTSDGERSHSATVYRFGQSLFQIDCGEPAARNFKRAGLSFDALDAFVLSHLHSDHVGGIFMFLQTCWLEKRSRDLHIYMPAEGIEPLRQMLRAAYLFDEAIGFAVRFEGLTSEQAVQIGSIKVTPFPTTHLERTRKKHEAKYPNRFESFSLLVEAEGLRIGHSADIGAPLDLAPMLNSRMDLLICELAHFSPGELFGFLKGKEIKRLVLTHIAREWMTKKQELLAQAQKALPNMLVELASDGAMLKLG